MYHKKCHDYKKHYDCYDDDWYNWEDDCYKDDWDCDDWRKDDWDECKCKIEIKCTCKGRKKKCRKKCKKCCDCARHFFD